MVTVASSCGWICRQVLIPPTTISSWHGASGRSACLHDATLQWLTSYLSDREQSMQLGPPLSDMVHPPTGVPQRSILGPLFFILCAVDDLIDIMRSQSLQPHVCANDTELYGSCRPDPPSNGFNWDLPIQAADGHPPANFFYAHQLSPRQLLSCPLSMSNATSRGHKLDAAEDICIPCRIHVVRKARSYCYCCPHRPCTYRGAQYLISINQFYYTYCWL